MIDSIQTYYERMLWNLADILHDYFIAEDDNEIYNIHAEVEALVCRLEVIHEKRNRSAIC